MSAPPAPQCELQADTWLGPIRLTLPLEPGAGDSIDHLDFALAVQRCEPLLTLLESWLRCPIDPVPVHASVPKVPGLGIRLPHGVLAQPDTAVHLPWAALRHGRPPAELSSNSIWPPLDCELELARYPQIPADRSELAPGALLLLPQSFQSHWPVRLRCTQHKLALEGKALLEGRQIHLADGPQPMQRAEPAWRVVLASRLSVDIAQALGWTDAPVALDHEVRARLLDPADGSSLAEGSVIPVLQGAALLIGHSHPQDTLIGQDTEALAG